MSSSSLSSVVSGIVRASMGSSVSGTVTGEDLDRHIGEIILREAKQKAEQYKRDGYRAYLPPTDANVPRTNKRFLSSIIRNTDDHNKAILRSQALAAAELKEEREEQERRERKARADEAAQDRLRRLMSGGRHSVAEDRWRPDRDGRREGKKRERSSRRDDNWASVPRSRDKKRCWDEDEDEFLSRVGTSTSYRSHRENDSHNKHRRHRSRRQPDSRSRSPRRDQAGSTRHSRSRSRSRTRTKSDGGSNHSRKCHRRSHSHSDEDRGRSRRAESPANPKTSNGEPRRHRRHHSASRSRSPRRDKKKDKTKHFYTRTRSKDPDGKFSRSRPSSPSLSVHPDKPQTRRSVTSTSISPVPSATMSSPTPGPPSRTPSPAPISKMDKYFSPTYDPCLDVAPLASSSSLTIDVPATGLVDNAQFEGWDAMLELIRFRREDREEKKRLERLGLAPEKVKEGRGKKGQGMVSAAAENGKGIMEIEYKKKGAVREWDMGKEGF